MGFWSDWNELNSLNSVKLMHTQLVKSSNEWNSNASARNLISSYLGFGDFRSAAAVFFVGSSRNYLLWNSFLKEFQRSGGDPIQILEVFCELSSKGVNFGSRIICSVLRICSILTESWLGVETHALLIKRGLDMDAHLKCALMSFYGRCRGVDSAGNVFDEKLEREDIVWNEAVMVHFENGRPERAFQLFRDMQFSSVKANVSVIVKLIQACGKEKAHNVGNQIHGYVLRSGLDLNVSIGNSLIIMYSKNNKLKLARKIFDLISIRNLSSWNSIISGYAARGFLSDAWNLFKEMKSAHIEPDIVTWNCLLSGHFLHGSYQEVLTILRKMLCDSFRPNSTSITSALQAISELGSINFGKEIHSYVIRNRLHGDIYVETSLVDMYVKNHDLDSAQSVFYHMKSKSIFAWNSLISGFSFKGLFEDALTLLNKMEKEGINPDLVTWNSLVSGYSVWGHTKKAAALINQIKSLGLTPNVVSWTALISGCSKKGIHTSSLEFFTQMQKEGIKPNSVTISGVLQACAGLSLLQTGEEIHCHSIRKGFVNDVSVATALIGMYSRSGSLKSAHNVFRKINHKTLASWNCMIMGYALYGLGREALLLFDDMCELGIQPDAITFTALLSSCKNSGLIEEGWKLFDSMNRDHKITPTVEHYSCMVDLLGRAGYLDEAWDFIQTMPVEPDAAIWGALLGSSRIQKNMGLAEVAADKLFKLEPHNYANYAVMMNLYRSSKRWKEMHRIGSLARSVGVKGRDGWSWTQIGGRIHVFSEEGNPHPSEGKIYFELYQLVSEMKELGYVPDVESVPQDIDEKEKEKVLMSHPEKLAITFGLMKIRNSRPIRVVMNKRVCKDCHTAAKCITVVKECQIVLKDGGRVHHFREGRCSCNECW